MGKRFTEDKKMTPDEELAQWKIINWNVVSGRWGKSL